MAPRNSRQVGKCMEFSFWLVFEEAGGVRLTRTEPHPDRAERSMFVVATLPRSLWARPSLRAQLTVDESAPAPTELNLKVAQSALKEATGMDFDLRVADD